MTALVHIPFHGAQLAALRDAQGQIWVSIKQPCEALGIDDEAQRKRILRNIWGRRGVGSSIMEVPSKGGVQPTFMIASRAMLMWLATIETSRVNEAARPMLELFQLEVADVIEAHFNKGRAATSIEVSELRDQFSMVQQAYEESREEIALMNVMLGDRLLEPIGDTYARGLLNDMQECARFAHIMTPDVSERAWRERIDKDVRATVGFAKSEGNEWTSLPRYMLHRARNFLKNRLKGYLKDTKRKANMMLPFSTAAIVRKRSH